MHLYHTSDREIRQPDITYGRRNADFGQGFYLTPDKEFTYRWAGENAVVNEYELDETGLKIHHFTRNEEWFRYIFQNRRLQDSLKADVIIGPIANDTIFDTLGIFSSGYLKTEDALRLLLVGPEYMQVVIKSQKAASQLRWTGSERIERLSEDLRRAEQDTFYAMLAGEMEKITAE